MSENDKTLTVAIPMSDVNDAVWNSYVAGLKASHEWHTHKMTGDFVDCIVTKYNDFLRTVGTVK